MTTFALGGVPISPELGRLILAAHNAEFGPWIQHGLVHQHLHFRGATLLRNLYGRHHVATHFFPGVE